jgi:uncharacterized protein YlxP (DUF503 family)
MTNNNFKQINFTALKYKDSWNVISIINDLQLKYELTVADELDNQEVKFKVNITNVTIIKLNILEAYLKTNQFVDIVKL